MLVEVMIGFSVLLLAGILAMQFMIHNALCDVARIIIETRR